jgi:hypothetical protein
LAHFPVRDGLKDNKLEFKDLPHEKVHPSIIFRYGLLKALVLQCFIEISREKIEDGTIDIPRDWAYAGG